MAEKQAGHYDEEYAVRSAYHVHYSDSEYLPQWVQVEFLLRPFKEKHILDIGCGPGQFGAFLQDKGYTHYRGLDFSATAIEIGRSVCSFPLSVGNALDPEVLNSPYDAVVCLEVLEHMDQDLDLVRGLRIGTYCVFSVPNYDATSHVRWFRSERQVRSRYFRLVDIQRIHFINNIYILSGIRSDHSPSLFQDLLKTREPIGIGSFYERLKHRVVHFFKIKQA